MGHMNESGTTKLGNILHICNHVSKFVPVFFLIFCFKFHTSEILSWFDSLFSLLCLFCELIISDHAHNPGHSLYIYVCYVMSANKWKVLLKVLTAFKWPRLFLPCFCSWCPAPHNNLSSFFLKATLEKRILIFSACVSTFFLEIVFYLVCVDVVFSLPRNWYSFSEFWMRTLTSTYQGFKHNGFEI